ncbi:hypothetical protein GUJ93_ZPchr0007g3959 [Zizania palustris]|uniref:Uncharacterized protein n=1 Tax=Zizania palustris TaxID=103762 RepID=A0A8J5SUA6_ZIZPA|nr:hypothetical protein GUJ93_ZPchr0007g3959 [Zizania palustris]
MATLARHRLAAALFLTFLHAALAVEEWNSCGQNDHFSANSTYQSNLGQLSATLPKNATASGRFRAFFATGTVGTVPDIVYALTLCRGDIDNSTCEACVATAFQDAQQFCAYKKEVFIAYNECYLQYSNNNFLDSTSNGSPFFLANAQGVNATAEVYEAALGKFLNATSNYAVENSSRRFATAEADFDSTYHIYGLAQCTPDLSQDDCWSCLSDIIAMMPTHSSRRKGGRIIGLRCNYRYEAFPFFLGDTMLRLPALALANMTPPAATGDSTTMMDVQDIDSLFIDLLTLCAATGNFADSNRLGEGGFGAVYKGLLPSGEEIAVKRLSRSSAQGIEELKNELVLVAKLHHKNLVRLVGVCLQEHEKLLVYEYMPNRSIDTILFDPEKSKELFGGDQTREVTRRVVGTYGYMAPEYAIRGHYSMKSDIFSFGILMLEILTGRRSSGSFSRDQSVDLPSLVWKHWTMGTILQLMDPSLASHGPENQMLKCVHIGLLCVQNDPANRPMMSTVNVMLSSNTVSLHAPSKPSFLNPNSGTYSTMSVDDGSVTELEPR